jgi:hypothetical protein
VVTTGLLRLQLGCWTVCSFGSQDQRWRTCVLISDERLAEMGRVETAVIILLCLICKQSVLHSNTVYSLPVLQLNKICSLTIPQFNSVYRFPVLQHNAHYSHQHYSWIQSTTAIITVESSLQSHIIKLNPVYSTTLLSWIQSTVPHYYIWIQTTLPQH